MTPGGMASFPGAFPLASESMALLSSSTVGSLSSSSVTGKLVMVSSASLVTVFSREHSSK